MTARGRTALALAAAIAATAAAAAPATAGSFAVGGCEQVKDAQVDPIISFGRASDHIHTFRGNASIGARSTLATLRAARRTTCRRNSDTGKPGGGDLSSYWTQSLLERDPLTGKDRVVPIVSTATYYVGVHGDPSRIQPFPAGLKMLAGDPHAGPQEAERERKRGIVVWSCGAGGRLSEPGNKPSFCLDTDPRDGAAPSLRLELRFPSCWDGRAPSAAGSDPARANYDDSVHMAHRVAVNGNGASPWACPATHPVPVPMLHMIWTWQTRGGPDVRLANENPYGAHGDYFEAWDRAVLSKLVTNCLRRDAICGLGDTDRSAPRPPSLGGLSPFGSGYRTAAAAPRPPGRR